MNKSHLLGAFCAGLFSLGSVSTANAALIASWSGDGNAIDSVAGRNGTLVGGAGYATGIQGQAFDFSGTTDYVTVPDDNVWSFGNDSFTVELWANFETYGEGAQSLSSIFIGHDEGGGERNKWFFYYDEARERLGFHINGGSGRDYILSPTQFTPDFGEWQHFAVTRSGSSYEFYADGNSLGIATNSMEILNANATLTIGKAENVGYFDGLIDEVHIYDEALTSAQIMEISGVPLPAAAWLFGSGLLGLIGMARRKKAA